MPFKASGSVITNLREHLACNPSSYSTVAGTDSDDFMYNAVVQGTPCRNTHAIDGTAYASQQTADSWNAQLRDQFKQV